MLASDQIEALISLVGSLDRQTLVEQFASYRGSFPLDFTPQFLAGLSLDRLRHIFLAVCLQNQRLPEIEAETALESVA
jgi:esterase/lipase superfamily enzyme